MTVPSHAGPCTDAAHAGRVADLRPEELSPLQQQLREQIAGPRGGVVRGPFALWLRIPTLADRANQLGNALRLEGTLDKRVFEVVILVVARHWSAQYEWFAHAQAAESVGVSAAVIEAIRQRAAPASPSTTRASSSRPSRLRACARSSSPSRPTSCARRSTRSA